MDNNTAFDLVVKAVCPQARCSMSMLHTVAKCGWEVVDQVCVDEANCLRHDRPVCGVIRQSSWRQLRNPENLKRDGQRIHLGKLLAANHGLATVCFMNTV